MRMQRQTDGTYSVDGFKFGSADEAAAFIDRNPSPAGAAGTAAPASGKRSGSKWPWIIGGILLVLVVLIQAGNTPEAKAKSEARAAIELCWKEQGRKSLDPGTQRFVAGACETMENSFRERYRVNP